MQTMSQVTQSHGLTVEIVMHSLPISYLFVRAGENYLFSY